MKRVALIGLTALFLVTGWNTYGDKYKEAEEAVQQAQQHSAPTPTSSSSTPSKNNTPAINNSPSSAPIVKLESQTTSASPTAKNINTKPVPVSTKTVPDNTSKLKITLSSARLVENNHVGNEWSSSAKINGQEVKVGGSKELSLKSTDSIELEVSAIESDKYPDDATSRESIAVSSLSSKQTTAQLDVVVTENRGRYSGNTAKWIFVFKVQKK